MCGVRARVELSSGKRRNRGGPPGYGGPMGGGDRGGGGRYDNGDRGRGGRFVFLKRHKILQFFIFLDENLTVLMWQITCLDSGSPLA